MNAHGTSVFRPRIPRPSLPPPPGNPPRRVALRCLPQAVVGRKRLCNRLSALVADFIFGESELHHKQSSEESPTMAERAMLVPGAFQGSTAGRIITDLSQRAVGQQCLCELRGTLVANEVVG